MTDQEKQEILSRIAQAVIDLGAELRPPIDFHESCLCKSCSAYRDLRDWINRLEEVDVEPAGHY